MFPLPFTVQELKEDQLFGIPLTMTDAGGNTVVFPDSAIERTIRASVNSMERDLQMDLWKRKVLCRPLITHPTLKLGEDYDVAEDPYDYSAQTYFAYGYFRLRRYPLVSVESVTLRFPETTQIFDYPKEWLRINYRHGQIQIMAVAGTAVPALIGAAGGYLPLVTGGLLRSDLPQLIYVDYTSGLDFEDEAVKDQYQDLILALQKLAAANVMQQVGRGFRPGINSESLSEDGQSETVSYYRGKGGIYGQEVEALMNDVKAFIASFKAFHKGPIFTVL